MEEVLFVLGMIFFILCIMLALALKEEAKNKKFLEGEIERLLEEELKSKRQCYDMLTNQYFFSNDEEIQKMKERIDKNLGL